MSSLLFYFSLFLLLSSWAAAAAANSTTGAIFPETFDHNDRPECHSYLTDLVEDTCDGASDLGALNECLYSGEGATIFRDECLKTCYAGFIRCPSDPYEEWWLTCVDDHPQWCHDPPDLTFGFDRQMQKEHCTDEEVEEAKALASETTPPVICTAESDAFLSNFNRDCDEFVYLTDDEESIGTIISYKLALGLAVAFAAACIF